MHIRPALTEEAHQLSALVLRAKAQWGYAQKQLEAWRPSLAISAESLSARPTFVGEIDDLMVGFYSLAPSATVWELDNLWVAPEYMRRGLGRKLLAHALETAGAGGADHVVVDADPNALPFYMACGAIRVGEVAAPIPGQPDRMRPQLVFEITSLQARAMRKAKGRLP